MSWRGVELTIFYLEACAFQQGPPGAWVHPRRIEEVYQLVTQEGRQEVMKSAVKHVKRVRDVTRKRKGAWKSAECGKEDKGGETEGVVLCVWEGASHQRRG